MWLYFIAINIIAFFTMYADKRKARKGKWRISEKRIWLLAILGGATGALAGMFGFRHKTKHWLFVVLLPAVSIIQWLFLYHFT